MLALTVKQPWADAIARGLKLLENRSWAPPRGRIGEDLAIHAAVRDDRAGLERYRELAGDEARPLETMTKGSIVAIVRLVGALNLGTGEVLGDVEPGEVRASPWAAGPWVWVLADVRSLPEPVPCRGALGLWAVPKALAFDKR